MENPWSKEIDEIFKELNTGLQGLSGEDVRKRLERVGRNKLREIKGVTALQIFIEQWKNLFVILLLIASFIEIGMGIYHIEDEGIYDLLGGFLIVIIVLFIVILGFYQEYNAEKSLQALKKMLSPMTIVIRGGETKQIPAENLVPGDIVIIEAGDRIPADGRLIETSDLKVDESALTGESMPIGKNVKTLNGNVRIGDRTNMVFMGTSATYGRGSAVITATGMNTELGKIAREVQTIEREQTPLQRKMDDLGKKVSIAVVFVCFIIFLSLVLTNLDKLDTNLLLNMFIIAVALAVAAVPEALPGVVTIGLSLGTRRLVEKNALIRKLPAVETLGSTTIICSDKTGTLTKNEMTVRRIYFNGRIIEVTGEGYEPEGKFKGDYKEEDLKFLLEIGLLCNNSSMYREDGRWRIVGDPTEGSLVVVAGKCKLDKKDLENRYSRKKEIPFTSERKMMTTIHKKGDSYIAYTKGAPDIVIRKCDRIWIESRIEKLDENKRKTILEMNRKFGQEALRILALAYKPLGNTNLENNSNEEIEKNLIFVGLVGIIDPPRKEVKVAVEKCKGAGIRTIMITGDHKVTARAIAGELGMYRDGDEILTGADLEKITDDELKHRVDRISIYARVSPLHKLKIIKALKEKGEIVAMTGDGVNDAPALKKADIGIAMGITGTDVTKESADMILMDDNFASIVAAVEEGRGVYENIKKYFAYLISGNIGEVGIILLSIVIAPWIIHHLINNSIEIPLALSAIQILLINLVTDGLPAIALSWDPFEPNAMKRKPRDPDEPIYAGLKPFLLWYPVIMVIVMFIMYLSVFIETQDVFLTQTCVFLSIALFEVGQAFACRSTRYSSFHVGILKNKKLVFTVLISFIIIVGLVYAPNMEFHLFEKEIGLKELFHFSAPSLYLLLVILVTSSLGFIYLELHKYLWPRED